MPSESGAAFIVLHRGAFLFREEYGLENRDANAPLHIASMPFVLRYWRREG
jgi:hypothetical protein